MTVVLWKKIKAEEKEKIDYREREKGGEQWEERAITKYPK